MDDNRWAITQSMETVQIADVETEWHVAELEDNGKESRNIALRIGAGG
jgi:hypothetical protein